MGNILGFGTALYGHIDRRADDSYVATKWAIGLFIPLVPLQTLRVAKLGTSVNQSGYSISSVTRYNILEQKNLSVAQVLFTYFSLLIPILFLIAFALGFIAPKNDIAASVAMMVAVLSSPVFMLFYTLRIKRNPVVWTIIGFVFPLLPFIFAFFVKSRFPGKK
ncbi:MAG: hypothetical protein JXD23_17645 [Spirochaetales bacterium]|nr:hypothetical protein [Spirochaetales bacterium]